jgi:glutathione S-transferase
MLKGLNSAKVLQICKQTSRSLSSSAAPVKIYGFPLSQPYRSVILLCQSNEIKYEVVLVDALKGQNLKPDFKKIHPAGLLPCIEEEGLGVLGECSAILVYLAETRKLTQWYPTDPVTRAKVNCWMSWNHTNTRHCTSGLLRNKLFPPKTGGDELVAAAQKTLKGSLTFMEKQLEVTKFLVPGEKPTIADLVLLTELDTQSKEGFDFIDFTPYPNTVRWMGDMRTALPSYAEVFAPVKVIASARAAKLAK